MTLIMYRLSGDELTVVVDSLASGQGIVSDTQVRKHWINHDNRYLVTGMGAADMVAPWTQCVAGNRNSNLMEIAADWASLSERWQHFDSSVGTAYATMFAFGFLDGVATRLEMSSRNDFVPAWSARPGLAVPRVEQSILAKSPADLQSDSDADYFAVACHIAQTVNGQASYPTIGGLVWAIRMSANGRTEEHAIGRI